MDHKSLSTQNLFFKVYFSCNFLSELTPVCTHLPSHQWTLLWSEWEMPSVSSRTGTSGGFLDMGPHVLEDGPKVQSGSAASLNSLLPD